MAIEPNWVAVKGVREPLNPPIGVRAYDTITASVLINQIFDYNYIVISFTSSVQAIETWLK